MERLGALDLAPVIGDDAGWPWDIGVIGVLDGAALAGGDGRFQIEAARRIIEPRLGLVPRSRQLLYRPGPGLGWPLWVDAASFDIADHVRVFPLAALAGEAEFLAACERLRRRRLDPSRPRWEVWFLPGLAGGRVGVFAPVTSLNVGRIGPDRRLALVRGDLGRARAGGRAHGGTVNDVVLAAVAGGLRDLLISRGEPVTGLVLRASVPVSLHREPAGPPTGNRVGWMTVPLPAGEPSHTRRLEMIAAETTRGKKSARPGVTSGILRLALAQRAFNLYLPHQRYMNAFITNIPGPRAALRLAGAPLLEAFPLLAISGNMALGTAVISYAGQLNLTAVADRDRCPDIEVFAQGVRRALAELTQQDIQQDIQPDTPGDNTATPASR